MAPSEMREPTFLVLTALASGPQHGYALLREVEVLSGGRVRLKAGTLYGALGRLAGEGLVADVGEEVVDGRLRRYYDLTPAGSTTLAREAARLQDNASHAVTRLGARGVTA